MEFDLEIRKMRYNCRALIVLIVGGLLLVLSGCQQEAAVTPQPLSRPETSQPPDSSTKAATAAPVEKSGPRITFEKVFHDFGDVGPGTWKTWEFKFTNTGDDTLRIAKTKTTCGCTVARLSKQAYEPGQSGTVKVKYHAEKQPGRKNRHVYVHSNDKTKPKTILTVEVNIVFKVVHEPKVLNLALDKDNAGCPMITLKSLDGQPFAIKRIKSSHNCITADYDPSVEAVKFVIEPRVDMDKIRAHLNGTIDIDITHPDRRIINVPFKTLPLFKFSPPSIVLFGTDPKNPKPVEKEVWLACNYPMDFKIESTSSRKGIIKLLSQEKVGSRCRLNLQITAPPSTGRSKLFTDVFSVKMDNGQKLDLVCRGFYSKRAGKNDSDDDN